MKCPDYYTLMVQQIVNGKLFTATEMVTHIMLRAYAGNILQEIAESLDRSLLTSSGYVSQDRTWGSVPHWNDER